MRLDLEESASIPPRTTLPTVLGNCGVQVAVLEGRSKHVHQPFRQGAVQIVLPVTYGMLRRDATETCRSALRQRRHPVELRYWRMRTRHQRWRIDEFFRQCLRTFGRKKSFENLQNFVRISSKSRYFWRNFAKCWDSSGAELWKSCRSWKMLQNDYLLAKIGFDTAENERKEWCVPWFLGIDLADLHFTLSIGRF